MILSEKAGRETVTKCLFKFINIDKLVNKNRRQAAYFLFHADEMPTFSTFFVQSLILSLFLAFS